MLPHQHLPHPTGKLKRFWCGDIPFTAYQLNTGEIAMSQAQSLPSYGTVISRIAANFIKENHLPTIPAILPNQSLTTLYPLIPTVSALWNYFESQGKLNEQKKLLKGLLAETPILQDSDILLEKTSYFRIQVASAATTLAQVTTLEIQELSLSALLYEGNLYISDPEGLSIINVPLSWIIELNPAQKKTRYLKSKGFSFQEEILFYRENHLFQIRARTWSDWLIVWEYFASKGNNKALLLLRYLAGQSLEQRLIANTG